MASKKQKEAEKDEKKTARKVASGSPQGTKAKAKAKAPAKVEAPEVEAEAPKVDESSPEPEAAEAPIAAAPAAEPEPEPAPADVPPPLPVATPGGFAKARKLQQQAREEARRARERAARVRKDSPKALSHFEKLARAQAQLPATVQTAEKFVRDHTPKGQPGRRMSRLDYAKKHSSTERERGRKLAAKLQRMRRLARLKPQTPEVEAPAPEAAPESQD